MTLELIWAGMWTIGALAWFPVVWGNFHSGDRIGGSIAAIVPITCFVVASLPFVIGQ